MNEIIHRKCVRALVHSYDDRFLLVRITEPESKKTFWITPGGGKLEHEDDRTALARELLEETGFDGNVDGPLLWTRDFTFDWSGITYSCFEQFYWVRCEMFDASPTELDSLVEAASFAGLEWWTLDEMRRSSEVFAPLDLVEHIERLMEVGVPPAPTRLGP